MYEYLKSPRDVTKYTLTRGVPDYSNLTQWNLFETGYPFLVLVSIPNWLDKYAKKNTEIANLIANYKHILEYEFRGIDGLEDITTDTSEITNGIVTVAPITKVTRQSNSTFTMRYQEKSGSTLTRVHKLFLEGIKDPYTQAKTYKGLIEDGTLEPGYENEVFSFLYFVTDNTFREIEAAYYIVAAQPNNAQTSIYNQEKGDINFVEVGVSFNGFPITGVEINRRAKLILDSFHDANNPLKLHLDSEQFAYNAIDKIQVG